jgi:hypothetical protein
MAIPKRVADRIKSGLRSFRKVLEDAKSADRSEQDTVTIVTDMLAAVFGFNKYSELTGEYAIRGTFCDIAVKIDGKLKYLIEVKAVDKSLKENHLRQATDYAAKEGIEWVVLTNGVEWQAYRMIFEQPVRFEHVFTFNVLDGGSDIIDMVYMLSREGISKQAIDEYHEQRQILNRYVVSALMMSDPILKCIRRELRKMAPKMKVDTGQIEDLLKSEILKRDVVEGEEMTTARRKVRRASKRAKGKRSASSTPSHKTSANTEQGDNDAP